MIDNLQPLSTEAILAAARAGSRPTVSLPVLSARDIKPLFTPDTLPLNDSHTKDYLAQAIWNIYVSRRCFIGCDGCGALPISEDPSELGLDTINYKDITKFLRDAANEYETKLRLNFAGDYEPCLVVHLDDRKKTFADTVVNAIDLGHEVVFPVATTGAWLDNPIGLKNAEALGKLDQKYRQFSIGEDGQEGAYFILSVPRESSEYFRKHFGTESEHYFDRYVEQTVKNINLLAKNGELRVHLYHNGETEDQEIAQKMKEAIPPLLDREAATNTKLLVKPFTNETKPECCKPDYSWRLFYVNGFAPLVPGCLEEGELRWFSKPRNLKSLIERVPLVA